MGTLHRAVLVRRWAIVLVVFSALHASVACARSGKAHGTIPQPRYIEIDGKTHPEQVPDYALWQSIFHYFDSRSPVPADTKKGTVSLGAADYALLLKYAEMNLESEDACRPKAQELARTIVGTSSQRARQGLIERMRALELAQRQTSLDVADTLLSEMSASGRLALHEWATRFRTSISFRVLESDLSFFRRPR